MDIGDYCGILSCFLFVFVVVVVVCFLFFSPFSLYNYKLYIVDLGNLDNLYDNLSGLVAFHLLFSTIHCVLLF